MSERLFNTLSTLLADADVIVASVTATRGATPRHVGARMLITSDDARFSIGGGLAEARVVERARQMLVERTTTADMTIELGGGPDAAGVCGGRMQLALRRWHGDDDRAQARSIAAVLGDGKAATLPAAVAGSAHDVTLLPDPRLLIIGGGHCGTALAELSVKLDVERCVFDPRPDCFDGGAYDDGVRCVSGDWPALAALLDTARPIDAVLLNRDYRSDVETLRVLAARPPRFIGMMGSRRRIAEVRRALPGLIERLPMLQAPVGLEIGAETPHEIAVSILAQLIPLWAAQRGQVARRG